MRVNSIAGTSFGRVLKIETPESDGLKTMTDNNMVVEKPIKNVLNTISGQTSIYGEETSAKIGEFLRAQIGDYSNETGIYTRKVYGENYIFTGEDAVKAENIVKNAVQERKAINKRYIMGPTKDSTRAERVELDCEDLRKLYVKNCYLKRDEALVKMAEDDYEDNGEKIFITFDEDAPDRAKEIRYQKIGGAENLSVE